MLSTPHKSRSAPRRILQQRRQPVSHRRCRYSDKDNDNDDDFSSSLPLKSRIIDSDNKEHHHHHHRREDGDLTCCIQKNSSGGNGASSRRWWLSFSSSSFGVHSSNSNSNSSCSDNNNNSSSSSSKKKMQRESDVLPQRRQKRQYLQEQPLKKKLPADSSGSSAETTTATRTTATTNVLLWLQFTCPTELVPKIVSYAGPQTAAALGTTCRYWKRVMEREETWRCFCEELYKWRPGEAEPANWKTFYCHSPCVPVDYSTVTGALQAVLSSSLQQHRQQQQQQQHRNQHRRQQQQQRQRHAGAAVAVVVRILLRPGARHVLQQAVDVAAPPNCTVIIESMKMPDRLLWTATTAATKATTATTPMTTTPTPTLSNHLSAAANPIPGEEPTEHMDNSESSSPEEGGEEEEGNNVRRQHVHSPPAEMDTSIMMQSQHQQQQQPYPKRAEVQLFTTRRHNEPCFRVSSGTLVLKNVVLHHDCLGTDIWNGNAAVQVQPVEEDDEQELHAEINPLGQRQHDATQFRLPRVIIDKSYITSRSGRGVCGIDGGCVIIRRSAVQNCAATGVYVGGTACRARMEQSDIVGNGVGNHHRLLLLSGAAAAADGSSSGMIAAGHSGIYVERGVCRIVDCNISHNTLTGISAVSPDESALFLADSDIAYNRTQQIEMPPAGSAARNRSRFRNNRMMDAAAAVAAAVVHEESGHEEEDHDHDDHHCHGVVRSRSGLLRLPGGGRLRQQR